ncbi:hypothetical protein EGW08_018038 [Elysia chlorotica]|uniref:VWFA domain-containing protein n=1 Tax=Elysia chlorotica TaxID=188477 RepID=A0A3S1B220_ELYCH|nr:hypothetical protein EGW08_018038 [Elysia chlorotica]
MATTAARVALALCFVAAAQALLWDECQLPGTRRSLDLMVALAVSPVEDKFPYNLFQTSRMPDAVSQFVKALLPVFDYLHTRVSVVGLDRTFTRITPFINNRYRILTTFQRWEPREKRSVKPADMKSIRAMFRREARQDVVKAVILVVDQPPEDISVMTTESQLLQDDGVFVMIIGFSTASRYGDQLRQLTSGQKELITIASAYHLPTRVRPVKSSLCNVKFAGKGKVKVCIYEDGSQDQLSQFATLGTTRETLAIAVWVCNDNHCRATHYHRSDNYARPDNNYSRSYNNYARSDNNYARSYHNYARSYNDNDRNYDSGNHRSTGWKIRTHTLILVELLIQALIHSANSAPDIFEEVLILADDSESTRDFSGMSSHYSQDFVQFLKSLVSRMSFDRCHVGLAFFSDDVRFVGQSGTNKTDLLSELDTLDSSRHGFSGMDLTAALQAVTTVLASSRPRMIKTIVVLTDGQPTDLQAVSAVIAQARMNVPELRFVWVLTTLFDGQTAYRVSDYSNLASAATDMTFSTASRGQLGSLTIDHALCQGRPKSSI